MPVSSEAFRPAAFLHVFDGAVHVDGGEQRGGIVPDPVGIVLRSGHADVERLEVRQALVLDAQFAAGDGPVHEQVLVPWREGPAVSADPFVVFPVGHEHAATVDVSVTHGGRRAQGLEREPQQRFAGIGGHRVVLVAVDVLDDFTEFVFDHPDRVGLAASVGIHDRVEYVVGQVARPGRAAGIQADVLLQLQRADFLAVASCLLDDSWKAVVDRLVPIEFVHGCSVSNRRYDRPGVGIRACRKSLQAPVPRWPSGCTGGARSGSRGRAGRP